MEIWPHMESWHYWIIVGILLVIGEIFTPGFLLASFGLGAFGSSLAAYLGLAFKYQLLVFSIGTMIVFFGIRPVYIRFFSRFDDQRKTGIEALLGKTSIVMEPIINSENGGRILIGGENWKALSEDNEDIEAKETVIITRIEGATAYVKKTNREE